MFWRRNGYCRGLRKQNNKEIKVSGIGDSWYFGSK